MCKLGDVIIIKEFKNENNEIVKKHSFVVISDEKDIVESLEYDFVSNMMCSFHDEFHKRKKAKFKCNLTINEEFVEGKKINNKEGYIKADQLYYFKKENIEYKVIAHMSEELLEKIKKLIVELHNENKTKIITTNLQKV